MTLFGISDFWTFCLSVLVFLALRGPGTFALLTSSAKGGFRAGAGATFGIILGDQVLMWLAVAGVAALLAAHPTVFRLVQYAGAVYLAWIGLRLIFPRPGASSPIHIEPRHYLRQAFFITLLNPKAIVFYMAFFPLFVDPARHQGMLTFGVMAATIAVLTFAYGLVVVLLTHHLAERMRANPVISRVLEKVAGLFLLGFGIKLAVSK